MDKTNLITLFIVGKSIHDHKFIIVTLSSTEKGWRQRSADSKFHDVDYVSNEQIPDLLEWFKCDFFQYRMFENLSEALEYQAEKIDFHTLRHKKVST